MCVYSPVYIPALGGEALHICRTAPGVCLGHTSEGLTHILKSPGERLKLFGGVGSACACASEYVCVCRSRRVKTDKWHVCFSFKKYEKLDGEAAIFKSAVEEEVALLFTILLRCA